MKVAFDFWVNSELVIVYHSEDSIQVHEFTVVSKFKGQNFLEANIFLEDVDQKFFDRSCVCTLRDTYCKDVFRKN
ncbi:Uncharacterised protein [Streptococcus pneumoniae]|nr:Uncharacterised protein [Streptococcus pneumoniae]CKV39641.1 Uncharacterised protein [Mycobacterium tuberculosis]